MFQVNPVQQTDTYGQVDERLHYTYGAIYTSPALGIMKAGPGGNYVQTFKDKDGKRFDGGKTYRLHVPAERAGGGLLVADGVRQRDPLHDPEPEQRRGPLVVRQPQDRTPTARSICTSGRSAPAGMESNWIETVPGKGLYPMFRFYSPKEGLFDGTWKLPDVELTN